MAIAAVQLAAIAALHKAGSPKWARRIGWGLAAVHLGAGVWNVTLTW